MSRMTSELVSQICKDKGYYRSPELNTQLYLHFRGFIRIEGLDEFVNCRVLWLENNAIERIENLEALAVLDSLMLHHNALRSLQCSHNFASLRSLNVSHNFLSSLDGIEAMPHLEKLLASHNQLTCIAALQLVPNLTVVDVSHNNISDAAAFDALKQLPELRSVMLHGNSVVRERQSYRKLMIGEHKQLKFLDEMPVFEDERRCAEAFVRGGASEERLERDKIKLEKDERVVSQRKFFDDFLAEAAAEVASGAYNRSVDTNYFVTQGDDANDEQQLFIPHPKANTTTMVAAAPL